VWRPTLGRPRSASPRSHARSVHELRFLDDADDRPREVVVSFAVEARHLGGLAADERAADLAAATRESRHELLDALRLEDAHRDVIEEEERTAAVHENVVGGMTDEVVADRVMAVAEDGHLELGPDAVDRREEDLTIGAGDTERSRERSDIADHAGHERRAQVRFDALDRLFPLLDIDPRFLVAAHRRSPANASRRSGSSMGKCSPRGASGSVISRPSSWSATSARTISASNCVPA
jgi:hypothetical protein